jgi:hypothetical protein
MTIERRIARAFHLTDEAWMRHANPWSVWTRFSVLPLLLLALWSRVWIGAYAAIPFVLALAWNWLNPHAFSRPASTDNWASKAVLGERVWLNRDVVPVPAHHRRLPAILSIGSGIGLLFVIWGVVALAVWPTLFGTAIIYLCKLWLMDRMVWLYEEMKHDVKAYRHWLY